MATLATLRTAVASKIGLDNSSGGTEQLLVDGWVNDAVLDVLIRTRCKVITGTIPLAAGSWQYTLTAPTPLLFTEASISSAGSTTWPLLSSPEEIARLQGANSSGGSPSTRYAMEGDDLLLVYPTPSSADTLTVHYVPYPTALSAASDDPSSASFGVPRWLHKALEYYALSEAADYDQTANDKKSDFYRQRYQVEIQKAVKLLNRKPGRLRGVEIPGSRRRIPIGRPDQQGV